MTASPARDRPTTGGQDAQWRDLLLRAAVLSHFEVSWLGVDADDEVVDAFLDLEARRIRAADGLRHWTLDADTRRQVAELGVFELERAWAAVVHRPGDALQLTLDRCFSGWQVDLTSLGTIELNCLDAVVSWFGSLYPQLPDRTVLAARLAEMEFLAPFERLAGPDFAGRYRELESVLPHYASVDLPLMIFGIGGVGKSALLARHLLQRHAVGDLVAYLTFDHSALEVTAPGSLIAAIAEQLIAQGVERPELDRVIAAARDSTRSSSQVVHGSRTLSFDDKRIFGSLVGLKRAVQSSSRGRLLVVLDTVEVVQRQGSSAVHDLLRFVERVSFDLGAQVILAGRAALDGADAELALYELPGLDPVSAYELLRSLLGPGDPDVDLDRMIERFGTRPLTLRLIAQVLRRAHGDRALRDLAVHRELVDGELYRRFLRHIPDEDVQKLAHPGLTLRRITPELIQHVLAVPCEVEVADEDRAWQLFDQLSLEGMLVERGRPGELVHRADIRTIMLPWLVADQPEVVVDIHGRAVDYLSRHGSGDDQTAIEEVYHRLMLAQPGAEIDPRWRDFMLTPLLPALNELPPASQSYLASKSSKEQPDAYVDVDSTALAAAELQSRRTIVVNRVTRLVQQGSLESARRTLSDHRHATDDLAPEIDELELQVLELLGDVTDALEVAEQARGRAADAGDVRQVLNFTVHCARLLERVGLVEEADRLLHETLDQLSEVPGSVPLDLLRLTALTSRLRLARHQSRHDEELVAAALSLFERLPQRAMVDAPGLLRDLAAEVGEQSPAVLSLALRTAGLGATELDQPNGPGSAAEATDSLGLEDGWSGPTRAEHGSEIADLIESGSDEVAHSWSRSATSSYQTESDDAVQLEIESDTGFQATTDRLRVRLASSLTVIVGLEEESFRLLEDAVALRATGSTAVVLTAAPLAGGLAGAVRAAGARIVEVRQSPTELKNLLTRRGRSKVRALYAISARAADNQRWVAAFDGIIRDPTTTDQLPDAYVRTENVWQAELLRRAGNDGLRPRPAASSFARFTAIDEHGPTAEWLVGRLHEEQVDRLVILGRTALADAVCAEVAARSRETFVAGAPAALRTTGVVLLGPGSDLTAQRHRALQKAYGNPSDAELRAVRPVEPTGLALAEAIRGSARSVVLATSSWPDFDRGLAALPLTSAVQIWRPLVSLPPSEPVHHPAIVAFPVLRSTRHPSDWMQRISQASRDREQRTPALQPWWLDPEAPQLASIWSALCENGYAFGPGHRATRGFKLTGGALAQVAEREHEAWVFRHQLMLNPPGLPAIGLPANPASTLRPLTLHWVMLSQNQRDGLVSCLRRRIETLALLGYHVIPADLEDRSTPVIWRDELPPYDLPQPPTTAGG